MTPPEANHHVFRVLQSATRNAQGRTILTVLYLIVLALCFIVPVCYYCRLHCQDQRNRRQRAAYQREVIMATLGGQGSDNEEESSTAQTEARASRKKYRAERRARILQLFGPVSMILTERHFHRPLDSNNKGDDDIVPVEETKTAQTDDTDVTKKSSNEDASSNESDVEEGKTSIDEEYKFEEDDFYAEESGFIAVPSPGLNGSDTTRLVPCSCIICLQQYQVGEEIVWSSNPDCEHVFHESCIERWLIKQRGGPLCPCCRRDFIIDPFDLEAQSQDEDEGNIVIPSV